MEWRKHNWALGCIAVLVTFVVLAGGQLLWQKYAVAKPLDKIFSGVNGVEGTIWEDSGKNGEPVKISVTLKDVADLQKTYEDLLNGSQQILGRKSFKIIIKDSRTPALEQFYYQIHYYVQEAIYTGNFATMSDKIQEQARAAGVDVRIYVDISNVYIQVSQNTDSMYLVLPRHAEVRR
jgi:hypothetical protein